jgi:hypothetical protein
MAIQRGLPVWMKWIIGVGAVVVLLGGGAIALGHNPLQHMMGHGE